MNIYIYSRSTSSCCCYLFLLSTATCSSCNSLVCHCLLLPINSASHNHLLCMIFSPCRPTLRLLWLSQIFYDIFVVVNHQATFTYCCSHLLSLLRLLLLSYVARIFLSWNRIMFETCPTRMSDTYVVCIFKNLPRVHVSCLFQCCLVCAT